MTNRLHAMRKSNFTKHDPGGWKCIGNAEGRHAIRSVSGMTAAEFRRECKLLAT